MKQGIDSAVEVSRVHVRAALVVLVTVVLASIVRVASAETWQAPVGGKALALGEGRVACPGTAGDWTIEQDGHAVRPPTADDAVGKAVELKVAANAGRVRRDGDPLTLVATGRWPAIDAGGHDAVRRRRADRAARARAARRRRPLAERQRGGDDRCVAPQADATGERCAVSVGRGLPADPTAPDLSWLPAGARARPGRRHVRRGRVGGSEPTRRCFILDASSSPSLVPRDVSIDLAGGTASRIPLVHPEAVVGADCGAASCDVSGDVIVVGGVSSVSSVLSVRLRLAPRVVVQRGEAFDPSPILQVPVLPCAMSVASGDALRSVDGSRARRARGRPLRRRGQDAAVVQRGSRARRARAPWTPAEPRTCSSAWGASRGTRSS